jgi:hypothetical protein
MAIFLPVEMLKNLHSIAKKHPNINIIGLKYRIQGKKQNASGIFSRGVQISEKAAILSTLSS